VFARSALIRIDHSGTDRWTSPAIALAGPPVSLGANTLVIGRADVSPYRVSPDPVSDPTGVEVTFDVSRFRSPAWFVILRAYARQRESSVQGPSLTVRPASGPVGSTTSAEGHLCQETALQSSTSVLAVVTRPGWFVLVCYGPESTCPPTRSACVCASHHARRRSSSPPAGRSCRETASGSKPQGSRARRPRTSW
jgi:hypothetical protein